MLPASLSELIQDERMTIWYSVTTALMELLLRGVLEKRDLTSLRWILFGGEVFPPQHLKEMMAALPQARFSNVYGPSEVNQVTHFTVPALPNKYEQDYVPIGQLLEVVEGLVVDEQDQEVAAGEVGELLICGATRMQGYWNRPELTEQSFLRVRPFANSPYEKIFYRTGDMVRLDEDGELRFLGRRDRQVKVRGYRIELDEIEAALSLHPAVGETAVYLLGEDEDVTIEAAVVLRSGQTVKAADLKQHVALLLPPEGQPSSYVFHESFPRTGSGKISRRILQSLSQESYEN
jgi:acyl-coenzyme A synthetase/AMP-(fatty) acid ligase